MKRLFALFLLSFAALAHAQFTPEVIGVHVGSQHFGSNKYAPPDGYNNFNPGLYVRWHNGLTAGFYRNSLYKPSVYAGWTFTEPWLQMFSLTVGFVSGYEVKYTTATLHEGCTGFVDAGGFCRGSAGTFEESTQIKRRIRPLIAPSVRFGLDKVSSTLAGTSLRLTLLAPPNSAKAVHLSIEHKF
jgi:hypothetical protein